MKTLKKNISVLSLLLLLVATFVPMQRVDAATKSTFTKGNLCYQITSNKTCTVTGLSPKGTNCSKVTVPSKVSCDGKSYKVTKVANKAFANNSCLKNVKVSKSIKSIGTKAFSNCKNLQSVLCSSKGKTTRFSF